MAGDDLDIFLPRTSVAVFVLDASVGKVHLVVVVGQLVLTRPPSDLLWPPIRSSVTVLAAAISLLKEPLIVSLELVIENHTVDLATLVADAFLGALVSAIDVGVVGQLARLLDAGIEGLTGLVAA